MSARPWRMLWTVCLVNVGLALSLHVTLNDGAFDYARGFFIRSPFADSWGPMAHAVERLRATPADPIYTRLFFTEHTKFQYPVSSLLVLDLSQRATALPPEGMFAAFNKFSWHCILLTGVFSWALFSGGDRSSDAAMRHPTRLGRCLGLLPAIGLTLFFYPLTQSYALGQVQSWLTCLAALALLLWQRDKRGAAGAALGVCCAIKPQWWLFIVWGLLRREWRAVSCAAGTAAAAIVASAALYGVHHHFDYFRVLTYLTQHGEAYYPNQSINGLMNRLVGNGNSLEWRPDAFPPYDSFVYISTVGAALLLTGGALWWRWTSRATPLDLALLFLSLTMASPIAWEHHYGVLLPVFAVLGAAVASSRDVPRHVKWFLFLAYLVTSQRLDITNRFAGTQANILQSYLLFGALIVLVILYLVAQSECGRRRPIGEPRTPAGTMDPGSVRSLRL